MSTFPLSGKVTKAPLLVAPRYAQDKELLHYIKYKLYDAGFIVVREEYRLLNTEIAERLCVTLDYRPDYMNDETPIPLEPESNTNNNIMVESAMPTAAAAPPPVGPSPSDMVGTAYLFILAHRDCHAKLAGFLEKLRCGKSVCDEAEADNEATTVDDADIFRQFVLSRASGTTASSDPLWTNKTASGAKQAVALLFPRMLAEDVPTAVESREYVQARLKTALLPALTELSKTKPEEPLRWLAEKLLATNTQCPPMISEGN